MRQIGRGGLSPFSGLVLIATGSLLLLAGYLASLVSASATGADIARKSAAVSTPAWTFIGPEHLNEQANFGGLLIAPATTIAPTPTPALAGFYSAAGRVTSVAFDRQSSNLFVGTANGGVWRSADLGATFQPLVPLVPSSGVGTEAIGAIAIDTSTTPSTIYVATGEANNSADSYYGQGLFKSTNLGNSWRSLGVGVFGHAAFSRLAIVPNSPGPTVFAAAGLGFSAGRGDPDFQENSGLNTNGLFRSTDGGASWFHYAGGNFATSSPTPSPTPTPIMMPTPMPTVTPSPPPHKFACTLPGTNEPCPADDVVIDPNNPGQVYVALETDDVFASSDGGITWASACFSNDEPSCSFPHGHNQSQIGRESIAVGPHATGAPTACSAGTRACGTVYVMLGAPDGAEYSGFFKSTDGAITWTAETVPSFVNPTSLVTLDGTNSRDLALSSFDQTLLADPLDPTGSTVFFGGVGLYESTNSGGSWSFLAGNGGTHSNQHAVAFDSADNNTIFISNDGGAFKFALNTISNGKAAFTSLNNTLAAVQIRSIAPHPINNNFALAGSGDNGLLMFTALSPIPAGWTSIDTGDVGMALFDHANPNFAYHTFATTSAGASLSRSTDGGVTWDSADPTRSIQGAMSLDGDAGANLYPPLAGDPAVPGRVLFGSHFIYESTDGMLTWARQESTDLTGGCRDGTCALQDIEFARSDHTRAWALSIASNTDGHQANPATAPFAISYAPPFDTKFKVFNTTQANVGSGAVWNDVTKNFTSNVENSLQDLQATGIAVDPNNPTIAYLSLSGSRAATGVGHLYRTTNFGASWAMLDGAFFSPTGLPDIPVLKVMVERSDVTGATVYAGSDIGVYRSTDGGTTWSPFNQGTNPPVPVFDLEENDNNLIFLGTYGRGVYTMPAPAPAPVSLTVSPSTVKFGNSLVFGSNGQALAPIAVSVTDPKNSKQSRGVRITQAPQIIGAADFSIQSNTCGSGGLILAPNTGCTVKVGFQAQAAGLRSATLVMVDSATNSPQTVALSGTGVQGKVSISPLSISFPAQKVGTSSSARTVTISNHNPIPMGIQAIAIVGPTDFTFSTACGTSLAANHNCSVSVFFDPTTTGARAGTLQITDDAVGSPQQIKLSGQGR